MIPSSFFFSRPRWDGRREVGRIEIVVQCVDAVVLDWDSGREDGGGGDRRRTRISSGGKWVKSGYKGDATQLSRKLCGQSKRVVVHPGKGPLICIAGLYS